MGGALINSGTALNNPCDSPLGSLTYLVNRRCVERGLGIEAGALGVRVREGEGEGKGEGEGEGKGEGEG